MNKILQNELDMAMMQVDNTLKKQTKITPQQVLINFMMLKRDYLHQIPHKCVYVSKKVLNTIHKWDAEDCEKVMDKLPTSSGFGTRTCVFCLYHKEDLKRNCNSCEYGKEFGLCNYNTNDNNRYNYWNKKYSNSYLCISSKLTNKWLKQAKKGL